MNNQTHCPWEAAGSRIRTAFGNEHGDHLMVATCFHPGTSWMPEGMRHANAHLIAAAPDLRDACIASAHILSLLLSLVSENDRVRHSDRLTSYFDELGRVLAKSSGEEKVHD